MHRLTGDGKYTDKIIFTFEDSGSSCNVGACSQSQVFSIGDAGTNYCNMYSLYCSESGCHPLNNKLVYTEKVGKCTEQSPQKCTTV
jgi:hypothetical protein